LTRVERQVSMEPDEALSELPTQCDWGFKHDTDGNDYRWRGYKAHIIWADGMVPLGCVTTSASVHDSQAVIPMMKQLATSVISLYDLMDSAYDAPAIRQVSLDLGHVPLIDHNKRSGEKIDFAPAEAVRYRERSNAERGNSRLKDSFGLRSIRVRGHEKVHCHILLGIVALFADQVRKPIKQVTDF
jgi:Transposase DDE domain